MPSAGSDSSGVCQLGPEPPRREPSSRGRARSSFWGCRTLSRTSSPRSDSSPGPRPGTIAPFYPVGFPAHLAAAALVGGWETGPYLVSPIAAVLCLALALSPRPRARPSRRPGRRHDGRARRVAGLPLPGDPAHERHRGHALGDRARSSSPSGRVGGRRGRSPAARRSDSPCSCGRPICSSPCRSLFAIPLTLRCLGLALLGGAALGRGPRPRSTRRLRRLLATGYREHRSSRSDGARELPRSASGSYGSWISQHAHADRSARRHRLRIATGARLARDRAHASLVVLGVFLCFYCFYGPYESFGFLRFLLPGIPGLLLAAALGMRPGLARLPGTRPRPLRSRFSPWPSFSPSTATERARVGVFGTAEAQAAYPRSCRWAAATLPARSVVVADHTRAARSSTTRSFRTSAGTRSGPRDGRRCAPGSRSGGWRLYAVLYPEEEKGFAEHVPGAWRKVGAIREVGLWELPPLEPTGSAHANDAADRGFPAVAGHGRDRERVVARREARNREVEPEPRSVRIAGKVALDVRARITRRGVARRPELRLDAYSLDPGVVRRPPVRTSPGATMEPSAGKSSASRGGELSNPGRIVRE